MSEFIPLGVETQTAPLLLYEMYGLKGTPSIHYEQTVLKAWGDQDLPEGRPFRPGVVRELSVDGAW